MDQSLRGSCPSGLCVGRIDCEFVMTFGADWSLDEKSELATSGTDKAIAVTAIVNLLTAMLQSYEIHFFAMPYTGSLTT